VAPHRGSAWQKASITSLPSKLAGDEATISGIASKVANAASVLALAPFVSLDSGAVDGVKGQNIFFTGANVHIVDGSGATDDNGGALSGLGNLIVGYDEGASPATGSHNIVCGWDNSFSGDGGLVVGTMNSISGAFATVSGGFGNIASNYGASVSGGSGNTASGWGASVSGGAENTAGGSYTSVSGGGGEGTGLGLTESYAYGWIAGTHPGYPATAIYEAH
jgi:hypothetical protein